MERGSRKTLRGVVVSDKMDKTITVLVSTYVTDPLYKKRVKYSLFLVDTTLFVVITIVD